MSSNKRGEGLKALLVICHGWISSVKTFVSAKGGETKSEMRTCDIAQHCSGYSHPLCHNSNSQSHSASCDIVCAECSVVRLDIECTLHNTVRLRIY